MVRAAFGMGNGRWAIGKGGGGGLLEVFEFFAGELGEGFAGGFAAVLNGDAFVVDVFFVFEPVVAVFVGDDAEHGEEEALFGFGVGDDLEGALVEAVQGGFGDLGRVAVVDGEEVFDGSVGAGELLDEPGFSVVAAEFVDADFDLELGEEALADFFIGAVGVVEPGIEAVPLVGGEVFDFGWEFAGLHGFGMRFCVLNFRCFFHERPCLPVLGARRTGHWGGDTEGTEGEAQRGTEGGTEVGCRGMASTDFADGQRFLEG